MAIIEGKGTLTLTAQEYIKMMFELENSYKEISKKLDVLLSKFENVNNENENQEVNNNFFDSILNNLVGDIRKNIDGANEN